MVQKQINIKKVAIVVLNVIQFESIFPAIKEMRKNNISCDIIIPDYEKIPNADQGIVKMFNDTYKYLLSKKYNPIRKVSCSKKYSILLSPYPTEWVIEIKAKYKIRYLYGFVTKPEIAFAVTTNLYYDTILCMNDYDYSYMSAYTKSLIVGPIKFANYHKKIKKIKNKKTILYLPTYGNTCSIKFVYKKLCELKNKYNIITKAHHMTSYINDESDNLQKLKKIGKVFDQKTSILKLIQKADMVLSDNSGAIWDAIIAGVPVAIINNSKKNQYINKPLLQDELIKKDIIPGTNNINDLEKIIKKTLSKNYKNKQIKLKTNLFPITGKQTLKIFMSLINLIINNHFDENYKLAHDKLILYVSELEKIKNKNDNIIYLKEEINKLLIKNQELETRYFNLINNPIIKTELKALNLLKKVIKRKFI